MKNIKNTVMWMCSLVIALFHKIKNPIIRFVTNYRNYMLLGLLTFLGISIYKNIDLINIRLYASMTSLTSNINWVFMFDAEADKPLQSYSIYKSLMDYLGRPGEVPSIPLPHEFNVFWVKIQSSFVLLFNGYFFQNAIYKFLNFLKWLIQAAYYGYLVYQLLSLTIEQIYFENAMPTRGNLEIESKPLIAYKWIQKHIINPTSDFFIDLYQYTIQTKWVWVLILGLAFRFNGLALICDLATLFIYVPIAFDGVAIYETVLMIFITIWPLIVKLPKSLILVLAYLILDSIRKNHAEDTLYKHENYNEGFYSSTGTVITVSAPMEAGKTTLITDLNLIGERKIRKDSLAIMEEKHLLFPDFPFSRFEKDLDKRIRFGEILTFTHVKKYVKNAIQKPFQNGANHSLYGYNSHLIVNNGIGRISIFNALSDYGQAYFLYTRVNPLSMANYGIAYRYEFIDYGHFRKYYSDFFHDEDLTVHFSHIVDLDDYRLGKRLQPARIEVRGHGGVVITLTEFGKDRGNSIKNREYSKNNRQTFYEEEEANPLNDLMAEYQKLIRSACTISFRNMNKFITDEQRLEDINAEQRNISETQIFIEPQPETKNALVMFWAEPMILHKIVTGYLDNYYLKFRVKRSDRTLLFHLWGRLAYYCNLYLVRRYNRYGYKILRLRLKETVLDDKPTDSQKYFIQFRKIYSNRFATDPWSKFFEELNVQANVQIDDVAMYRELKADTKELEAQNSYFYKRIMKILKTIKGGE